MKFTLPEVPHNNEEKTDTPAPTTPPAPSAYDALLAKMGRKPERPKTETGESKPSRLHIPEKLRELTDDKDDDGYEVDERQADEAQKLIPEPLKGPLAMGAKILSWIMVPMFMPVISVILMLWLSAMRAMPEANKITVVMVIAGFNTILPMILIGVLRAIGLVRDVGLNSRRERFIPYVITIAGLVCSIFFLKMQGAPEWMWSTYVGAAAAICICCAVNFKWKISAHATGAGGVLATLLVINMYGSPVVNLTWWMFGAAILTGLLGSSRVFLRRHTDMQVLAGVVNGFLCVYLAALILSA